MSTVNLQGATSGAIALVPTAIAGSNTVTIPAETGTLRTTVSSGTVLQVVTYKTGAMATGTTIIPYDDTIPQNTEGNQYMSLAITPRSATSVLLVEVNCLISNTFAGFQNLGVALFIDSTASAVAATDMTAGQQWVMAIPLAYSQTSGGTSSMTFKVRAGSGSAGTTTFNGTAGVRIYGGVNFSSITITEVVP